MSHHRKPTTGLFARKKSMALKERKGKQKGKEQVRRVSFDFSAEAFKQLEELRQATDARTKAEVVRKALSLYREAIDAESRNALLCIRENDGSLIGLKIL